jgi:hypothetical protein
MFNFLGSQVTRPLSIKLGLQALCRKGETLESDGSTARNENVESYS